MDEGGDAAVIHPPALDPNSTALALQAIRDYPRRFAIMGAHDLLFQPPNGSSGGILTSYTDKPECRLTARSRNLRRDDSTTAETRQKRAVRPQRTTQAAEAFEAAGRRSFAPFGVRDHQSTG